MSKNNNAVLIVGVGLGALILYSAARSNQGSGSGINFSLPSLFSPTSGGGPLGGALGGLGDALGSLGIPLFPRAKFDPWAHRAQEIEKRAIFAELFPESYAAWEESLPALPDPDNEGHGDNLTPEEQRAVLDDLFPESAAARG